MNYHIPVLLDQIISNFNFSDFVHRNSLVIVDACFGEGGYTKEFLKLDKRIRVIGIEQDKELYNKVKNRFDNSKVHLYNTNFINIDKIFEEEGINFANYFIFDLGISMYHIKESKIGITFNDEQPLDMRMSDNCEYSAYEVINSFQYEKLANIFYEYGQEHASRRIAKAIIEKRKKKKIKTTLELAEIVASIKGRKSKIHPATKVFQALRIFVNKELENLELALLESIRRTIIKGRIFVVTYHSLEDRVVKNLFKREIENKKIIKINKKPIIPEYEEIKKNRSARSAKLRICQKVSI